VLEAALLSSLAESHSHGYELVEQIETLAAELVCIDPGSMYRFLRGMEEQGLVRSSWQTPEAGPSRRVYEITDEGIEALELMAEALSQRAAATQRLADHASQAVARARGSKN
jgi:DNA-binding PadR family transcriptional regulator